ncbi:hypothetical protein BST61_g766 [Cercospora zeina]
MDVHSYFILLLKIHVVSHCGGSWYQNAPVLDNNDVKLQLYTEVLQILLIVAADAAQRTTNISHDLPR